MHPTPDSPPAGTPPDAGTAEAQQATATAMVDGADAAQTPETTTAEPAPAPAVAAADAAPAPAPLPDLSPVACAARLAELFPAVFTPGRPQPLKLRIQTDIQERAPGIFTRKALSTFLHRHTTNTAYLRTLVSAPSRIDLGGEPSGEVAPEHREAATLELQRRRDLFEARRVAERQAQRQAHTDAQRDAQRQPQPIAERVAGQGDGRPAQAVLVEARRAAPADRDARRAPPGQGEDPRRARPAQREGGRMPPPHGDAQRAQPSHRDARRSQPAQGEGRQDPRATDQGRRAPIAQADASRAMPASAVHAAQSPQPPQAPQDPQRRERQALLRAYESSTLTRRNFCALKGMSETELEAQLALARQEVPPAPPAPSPAHNPPTRGPADARARAPRGA